MRQAYRYRTSVGHIAIERNSSTIPITPSPGRKAYHCAGERAWSFSDLAVVAETANTCRAFAQTRLVSPDDLATTPLGTLMGRTSARHDIVSRLSENKMRVLCSRSVRRQYEVRLGAYAARRYTVSDDKRTLRQLMHTTAAHANADIPPPGTIVDDLVSLQCALHTIHMCILWKGHDRQRCPVFHCAHLYMLR